MPGRLAGVTLAIAAAIAAAQIAFAVQLGRPMALRVAPAVAAALLLAALRLAPARRVKAALVAAACLAGAFGVEYALGRAQPREATLAARRGVAFDTRTRWEVIRDERRAGRDAYPSMDPRARLTADATTLPLGGIADKPTVFCNEGGAYTIYDSDEHGFNNPRGLWGRGAVDVGIVGEAFAQGACAPAGAGLADRIRERYPATLDVGMAGNGPLLELGGLLEYLAAVRPRVVLWLYYDHDLEALRAERASPLLRRYLEGDALQGLLADQGAIDRGLASLAQLAEAAAIGWPARLASLGLTRASTPTWAQDLVMGEQHASASVVMRLDRLNGFAAAHLPASRPAPQPAPPSASAPAAPGEPPGGRSAGRSDLAVYRAILTKARAAVASWGGTLHFVYLADLHNLRGPEHPARRAILAVAKDVGLPLIDVQPVFAAVPDPMTLRFGAESHCNEAGHRLIADTVLAALAHSP